MDYDNNATKVGLLSNKEKTFKSSDVHDADIELQEVNHQEYLSFEEAKQCSNFFIMVFFRNQVLKKNYATRST